MGRSITSVRRSPMDDYHALMALGATSIQLKNVCRLAHVAQRSTSAPTVMLVGEVMHVATSFSSFGISVMSEMELACLLNSIGDMPGNAGPQVRHRISAEDSYQKQKLMRRFDTWSS